MHTVHRQNVAFFGTLAAWPDSPHAQTVLSHARHALSDNAIAGEFLCMGKLSQQRFHTYMNPAYADATHPMTPERKARLLEGQHHPDAGDLARAADFFQRIALRLIPEKTF